MNSHPLILWVRRGLQLLFNFFCLSALFWIAIWIGVFWLWVEDFDVERFLEIRKFIWDSRNVDLRSWFFIYASAVVSVQFALLMAVYLDAKFKRHHDLFSRGAKLENHC